MRRRGHSVGDSIMLFVYALATVRWRQMLGERRGRVIPRRKRHARRLFLLVLVLQVLVVLVLVRPT